MRCPSPRPSPPTRNLSAISTSRGGEGESLGALVSTGSAPLAGRRAALHSWLQSYAPAGAVLAAAPSRRRHRFLRLSSSTARAEAVVISPLSLCIVGGFARAGEFGMLGRLLTPPFGFFDVADVGEGFGDEGVGFREELRVALVFGFAEAGDEF